jgi:hypothetical protein
MLAHQHQESINWQLRSLPWMFSEDQDLLADRRKTAVGTSRGWPLAPFSDFFALCSKPAFWLVPEILTSPWASHRFLPQNLPNQRTKVSCWQKAVHELFWRLLPEAGNADWYSQTHTLPYTPILLYFCGCLAEDLPCGGVLSAGWGERSKGPRNAFVSIKVVRGWTEEVARNWQLQSCWFVVLPWVH